MSESKKCQKCSQGIQEGEYYSFHLNKKQICLCSNCWETEKDNYKETLKEERQQDITRQYQSSGHNQEVDKDSSEVIDTIHVWKTEQDNLGSHSTEFGICFGCGQWKEEKEHGTTCQDQDAEKRELEILQSRDDYEKGRGGIPGLPLNDTEKKRLQELLKKYSNLEINNLNQIKSNQIKSNQIKSNQIKSNQIKSNQIKSNQSSVSGQNIDSNSKLKNYLPWVLGGAGIVSLVGVLAWFLIRKNKEN